MRWYVVMSVFIFLSYFIFVFAHMIICYCLDEKKEREKLWHSPGFFQNRLFDEMKQK